MKIVLPTWRSSVAIEGMARAPRKTTTYRFHGADGDELHCGITDKPKRREGEHRRRFDEPYGELRPEGGQKTRAGARAWEKAQGCSPYDRIEPPARRVRAYSPRRTSSGGSLLDAVVTVAGATAAGIGLGVLLGSIFGGGKKSPPPAPRGP